MRMRPFPALMLLGAVILSCSNLFGQITISEVRLVYPQAVDDEETCKDLYDKFESEKKKLTPLMMGYKGSINALMSKHSGNPFSKMSYFNDGKKLLENAIRADSANAELRFLRITMQVNLPSFLMYNENIEEDKVLLISQLPSVSNEKTKKTIATFLIKSDCTTAKEKKKIEELLN